MPTCTGSPCSACASARFDVFYATSDNAYQWGDIDHAREVLGYAPQDNAEERLGERE